MPCSQVPLADCQDELSDFLDIDELDELLHNIEHSTATNSQQVCATQTPQPSVLTIATMPVLCAQHFRCSNLVKVH